MYVARLLIIVDGAVSVTAAARVDASL